MNAACSRDGIVRLYSRRCRWRETCSLLFGAAVMMAAYGLWKSRQEKHFNKGI